MKNSSGISIVIASFNSELRLPLIKECLEKQSFLLNGGDLEILIVDGGSTDSTLELAESYGWKTVLNHKGDPMTAKQCGFALAKYDFITFLDHDELFTSNHALKNRFDILNRSSDIVGVFATGYKFDSARQLGSNIYQSLYGDPVSFFAYRMENDPSRVAQLSKRLVLEKREIEMMSFYILGKHISTKRVLLETSSMGTTVNRRLFLNLASRSALEAHELPHMFYLTGILSNLHYFAILEDDFIEHDSSSNWVAITKKMSWKANNLLNSTDLSMANAGIRRRFELEDFLCCRMGLRPRPTFVQLKVLYFAYCLSLVFPIIDALLMIVKFKDRSFIHHFSLNYRLVLSIASTKLKFKSNNRYGI
jgi:glycosyltransferase involved in cell wall biosynthesis